MTLSIAPGLPLACWKAGLNSLLAVCGITSVVGLFFVPDEIERLTAPRAYLVRQFEPLAGGGTFAAIESRINPQIEMGLESRLVTYEWDGDVACRTLLNFPPDPVCLAAHPNGFPLFVSRPNGEILAVGLLPSAESAAALVGRHSWGYAQSLACTLDGRTLVSSDLDRLYVWNLEQWRLQWSLAAGVEVSWGIHPDSQRLVCCRDLGQEHAVQMLDLATGQATTIYQCRQGAWRSLQVGLQGRTITGVNAEGQIRVLQTTEEHGPWQLVKLPMIEPHPEQLYALSPDEDFLAAAQRGDSCLQIWNLRTGEPICRLQLDRYSLPIGMRFLSNEQLVAWGSRDATWVWEFSRSDRATAIQICDAAPNRSWNFSLSPVSSIE
jgi:hypothetical protein